MTWSAHLTTGRYLRGYAVALPVWFYLVFVALAVAIGTLQWPGSSLLGSVVHVVALLVFVFALFALAVLRTLRRTLRAAGASVISYRLDAETHTVQTGQDLVQLPRRSLRVRRSGRHFLTFSRVGFGSRAALLLFDDPETLARVAAELG